MLPDDSVNTATDVHLPVPMLMLPAQHACAVKGAVQGAQHAPLTVLAPTHPPLLRASLHKCTGPCARSPAACLLADCSHMH
mmetsp:Transcript_24135/g.62167  ORF Transcript_24135/g.62167 Transcript_24135/m.62167 type:complete len:81 (+) Transcript_24135:289-531(+)